MDPFPAQILPEVNVEGADTAVLLQVATIKTCIGNKQKERETDYKKLTYIFLFLLAVSTTAIIGGNPSPPNPWFKCVWLQQ